MLKVIGVLISILLISKFLSDNKSYGEMTYKDILDRASHRR